jgi:hypothetical protein
VLGESLRGSHTCAAFSEITSILDFPCIGMTATDSKIPAGAVGITGFTGLRMLRMLRTLTDFILRQSLLCIR